ncbi:MAG: reductive dehalogenase [Dehalogenimonas sp.]
MSRFHSIVSRRDFMKSIGMTGVGLGAAAAVTPMFHDLDELAASSDIHPKMPWYVKERDFMDPTTPIDWNQIKRFDTSIRGGEAGKKGLGLGYYTPEVVNKIVEACKKEDPNWSPGPSNQGDLRAEALAAGSQFLMFGMLNIRDSGFPPSPYGLRPQTPSIYTLLGPRIAKTPEERGIPKWQGTPEENLRLVRSAVRFWGGNDVGCVPLDETTKKLVWSRHQPGCVCSASTNAKAHVFEEAELAYQTNEKLVYPNKCKWVLVWTLRQPQDTIRRMQGQTEGAAVWIAYSRIAIIESRIQEFLRTLGYQGVSGGTSEIGPAGGWAVLGGMGELGRISYIIHPKYGATMRGMNRMITDFPLAPTKPIDSGIRRFCYTCRVCADACPVGALEQGDPSWEAKNNFQISGYEQWRVDEGICPHCPICQGTCVFNTQDDQSWLHNVVKGTVATTPILNSFFYNMHKTFGYGRKPMDEWWNLERPENDYESSR